MKNIAKSLCIMIYAAMLLTAATAQSSLPQPREEKLLNGLKVLMWPDAKADSVTVRVRVHSGSSFDPQGKEGVMKLLAENIFPEPAAREFFTEDLGGGLSITTTYDFIEIKASGKPDSFLSMLETLSAAIANPTIDKPTTAKLKTALIASVKERESDTAYAADRAAAARLFGTFPYGRAEWGSSESIKKIDFADLIDAKQRFLTADNATVIVTGNFDRTLGFRAIRRLFGAWLKSDRRVPSTFRQPDPPPAGVLMMASPKANSHAVRFITRGASRNDKNFAAAQVYASIIETRLKARVPAEHMADVFVRSESHILPGSFVIGFGGTRNDIGQANGKVEATDLVLKVLAEPVTEAEFQAARSAFRDVWSKRDTFTYFLDADTFKIASPNADVQIADTVTLSDVRGFAAMVGAQPMATVVVSSPAVK